MLRSRPKNFCGTLAAALLFASVALSSSVFAGFTPNTTLEPAEDTADTGDTVEAAATPVVATEEPASYSGEIRRYPVSGSPTVVYGALSLSITALGKVTGSITWYDTAGKVKITGKQDLNTKQGSFVIRDAQGNRVPGAPRLPFRIGQKGKLVGGGITDAGETASFKLLKQSATSGSGYVSEGGATLTLGASNSYSGSSSISVNTSTLSSGLTGSTLATGVGTLNLSGVTTTTLGSVNLSNVTGTLSTTALTGTTGPLVLGNGSTLVITTGSGNTPVPTLTADGNLTLGSSVLLLAPVTSTTASDGTITYTGTSSTGGTSTVIVHGAASGG